MNRDKTIDRLRALAIFQVIFVHVLYWGNFFSNSYINFLKSFFLFEMPLFFFITGASNSFSKAPGYFSFVYKRFKRILIPYWVFAVICVILSIVKYSFEGNMNLFMGIKVFLSWMIPINRQMTSVPYLIYALWFIPVYLCVVLMLPVLKKFSISKQKAAVILPLLALYIVTCMLKLGWIQNVAFYAFWTYIGLLYNDTKSLLPQKHFRAGVLCAIGGGILTLIVGYLTRCDLNMYSNKYPPTIMFGAFSVVVMGVIMLLIPIINKLMEHLEKSKVLSKFIEIYSHKSMTIFLYQVFAFNLTIRAANVIISGNSLIVEMGKAFFCLLMTLPICAGLATVFGRVENIGNKRRNNI